MLSTAKQAIEMATKYQSNIEGLKQAINDNGGIDKFRQALGLLDNPKIANTLNKVGINTDSIRNIGNQVIGTNSSDINNIKNRLSRLQNR